MGSILGSFSNAMIHRIPLGVSLWRSSSKDLERSVCIHCSHVLSWKDLIPLLSWLSLFGRCRYCNVPIGFRYLWVEVFSAVSCGVILLVGGFYWLTGVCLSLVPIFVTGSIIFFRYRKISMLKSLCFMALVICFCASLIFLWLP